MRLLDHLSEILGKDARVDGRGLDRAVAEELLDVAHAGATLNEMRGVGMS
jgi:hypothetical protein